MKSINLILNSLRKLFKNDLQNRHIKTIWSMWLDRNLRGHGFSPLPPHSVPSLHQRRDLQSLRGVICVPLWSAEVNRETQKRRGWENRNLTAVCNIMQPNIWNRGNLEHIVKIMEVKERWYGVVLLSRVNVQMLNHKASHKSHYWQNTHTHAPDVTLLCKPP